MNKKKISRNGYRVLAIVWTAAAASMAVAVARRLPDFSVPALCLLAASITAAAFFWKAYHRMGGSRGVRDPFENPPKFAENPVLFDDDPPPRSAPLFDGGGPDLTKDPNKTLEEKDHE